MTANESLVRYLKNNHGREYNYFDIDTSSFYNWCCGMDSLQILFGSISRSSQIRF